MTQFKKMHGLGNDFIVFDIREGDNLPEKEKLAALTERRTGIGCDQIIVLEDARRQSRCFHAYFERPRYQRSASLRQCHALYRITCYERA